MSHRITRRSSLGAPLAAALTAALLFAGCGGGSDGASDAASAGAPTKTTATRPEVVIGADGRPITGAIQAPKPADPDRAVGAYLRGFDECALADEAVAPPNTKPIFISGGQADGTELGLAQGTLEAEHSKTLGSDLWVHPSEEEAEAALPQLKAAVAKMPGVTVGRVERVLYATRGTGVASPLRACTERGNAAEAAVAAPDQVQRLTAAEEEFIRGPATDLGIWCYEDSMRTGDPGSTVAEAKETARRLEQLVAAKPDAQTSGGDTVRETAAEVVSGLEGYDGCPVASVGDDLEQALR